MNKRRNGLKPIINSSGSWLVFIEQTEMRGFGKWVIELTSFFDNLNFKRYFFSSKKAAMQFYKDLQSCSSL